jgi:hypothetical protein
MRPSRIFGAVIRTCRSPRMAGVAACCYPRRAERRTVRAVVPPAPPERMSRSAPADEAGPRRQAGCDRAQRPSSARSKKPTTRRSYACGCAFRPPVCGVSGSSQSVFGSPAARCDRRLRACREAEHADAADAVSAQPAHRPFEVAMPRPAEVLGPALAVARAARVVGEDAVAVPGEHEDARPRAAGAVAARPVQDDDRGAVPRGHVPARDLQAVGRREGDVPVRDRERRVLHVDGLLVRDVHRAAERLDDPDERHDRDGDRAHAGGPARERTTRRLRPRDEERGEDEQHDPAEAGAQAGEVGAPEPAVPRDVGEVEAAVDDEERAEDEGDPGTDAARQARERRHGCERHGRRHRVRREVAPDRDAARPVDQRVVQQVEEDERVRGREDRECERPGPDQDWHRVILSPRAG